MGRNCIGKQPLNIIGAISLLSTSIAEGARVANPQSPLQTGVTQQFEATSWMTSRPGCLLTKDNAGTSTFSVRKEMESGHKFIQ